MSTAQRIQLPDGSIVNLPGGGSKEWRLIKTVTVSEPVVSLLFDKDEDGNPFEVEEIFVYGKNVVVDTSVTQGSLILNKYNGNGTTLNSFFTGQSKSFFFYSCWRGLRIVESQSSTYNLAGSAQSGSANRIIEYDPTYGELEKITKVGVGNQGSNFTSGTMYFYAR